MNANSTANYQVASLSLKSNTGLEKVNKSQKQTERSESSVKGCDFLKKCKVSNPNRFKRRTSKTLNSCTHTGIQCLYIKRWALAGLILIKTQVALS